MPFEFSMEVDDLNRYVRQLEAAAGGISKAARRTAGKWARVGVKEARRRVHVITGELRDSIQVVDDGGIATMAALAPYAGYEEFGTVHRPPHPYMRPAVAVIRRPFKEELAELGARLLGTKTAARSALTGAVPRGSSFSPGGASRAASRASIESGGLPS